MEQKLFQKTVIRIALPVTLQCLLQSSFSVIDQIMIGQLGSNSIAGIGLGGKFASLYLVLLNAIAAIAGIMISQYMGKEDKIAVSKSFFVNLILAFGLAVAFMCLSITFPHLIMGIYTKDNATRMLAAEYLRIFAFSFVPMSITVILTTLLRCMEAANLALYASVFALILNTGLNYLLIFGKWIFPALGVKRAALASVIAQIVCCGVISFFFIIVMKRKQLKLHSMSWKKTLDIGYWKQYLCILCPMLICEFIWSLGENVYAAIYGNMGTDACAAITMTLPIQTLVIGALSGLAQASGILIGKALGTGDEVRSYRESKYLVKYGLYGSLFLSLLLVMVSPFYVRIYNVDSAVQILTRNILIVFAIISPIKVQNMILGGGILRSGGKTKYTMWIDFIGTWLLGVPMGLIAAFIWNLSIPYVYLILSIEECARLGISVVIFKKKVWMERLD